MSYSYSNICPSDITVDADVVSFFETFFKTSDTPETSDRPDIHEQYARQFTEDATFILASRVAKGRNEVLETRKGMWAAVSSRRHTVHKIFPFGNNAKEVMLYGTVEYELKAGGRSAKDWAARAVLRKEEDGKLRMENYQIYLDTK